MGMSARDVGRVLETNGFVLVRQRGSHIVYQLAKESGTTTVVVPNHRELATGTLGSIIRQSGLTREAFTQ